MAKPRILLIHPTIRQEGVEILQQKAEILLAPDGREDTLIEYVQKDIHAIIVRVEHITSPIIEAGRALRVIGQNGVGVDNIDVEAATRQGVAVINAPLANYISVAEHVVSFILALAKQTVEADKAVRTEDWDFRNRKLPTEISGKSVLLVGFGRNARETAKMLKTAFSMQIFAYDPYVDEEEMTRFGVKKVESLKTTLANVEIISLHIPYTPQTHHLFNKDLFNSMKGCYFINCSRGKVADTNALREALRNGNVIAAGLDVFEEEPPSASCGFFDLKNVILSPHYAGDTIEAKIRCATTIARNVLSALEGKMPESLVNAELAHLFANSRPCGTENKEKKG